LFCKEFIVVWREAWKRGYETMPGVDRSGLSVQVSSMQQHFSCVDMHENELIIER
jgi:hypothetical protein